MRSVRTRPSVPGTPTTQTMIFCIEFEDCPDISTDCAECVSSMQACDADGNIAFIEFIIPGQGNRFTFSPDILTTSMGTGGTTPPMETTTPTLPPPEPGTNHQIDKPRFKDLKTFLILVTICLSWEEIP